MVALVMDDRVTRADIPALCAQAEALLEDAHGDLLICDAGALAGADAVVVDALARLQLVARRFGCEFRVRRASPELTRLITLMGLGDIVL